MPPSPLQPAPDLWAHVLACASLLEDIALAVVVFYLFEGFKFDWCTPLRRMPAALPCPALPCLQKYDPDSSTTLSLDEYIRMCLFLQSCVRTFGAFDSQRVGTITVDFNQFVYACSHIA